MEPDEEPDVLEKKNYHIRDKNVSFTKATHKYLISRELDGINSEIIQFDNGYVSVTTFIQEHFETFDDDLAIKTMTKSRKWKEGHKWWAWRDKLDELKLEWKRIRDDASHRGEELHARIELFMNNEKLNYPYSFGDLLKDYEQNHKEHQILNETDEMKKLWSLFLNFVKDFSLYQPYRTEWRIYHEEAKIAGSLDLLCKIPNTTFYCLMDWKSCKEISGDNKFEHFAKTDCIKHLADNNFTHYALQQNMYRTILKEKYGINIISMFLIRIHPDSDNYQLIEVPDMTREIKLLFDLRK